MKYAIIILLLLTSCTTARRLDDVKPGMTEEQVRQQLGRPRSIGLNKSGEYFVYNFANHSAAPISGGRTNYFVQFKDGKVVSYGALSTMKNE